MNILKTTKSQAEYWRNRKADWKSAYLDTFNHPHRRLIIEALKSFNWLSLLEIGCNAAPNLYNIVKELPGRQVGGIDVNPEAIELCNKTFQNGLFKVNSADDIMMSDKSVDVILSDMVLIYVSPWDIKKYLKEIRRVARNHVVFCEFHSDSLWNRFALKMNTGYNAYNYKKLLADNGFYDIQTYKLKESDWPGGNPQKNFAYLIMAKVSKY